MSRLDVLKVITTHPLNKGRKLRAIIHFAKWQVASRLIGTDIVCDWVNGSKFLVRTGETGLTGNVYTGLHDFADMGFLLHVLRKEDLFVDVGANVGSYSLLAGSVLGARVCAFEPVPATYARLVQNIRLNRSEDTVRCLNIGIGRAPGTVKFTGDLDTTNHVIVDGESHANAMNVEVITLDHAMLGEDPFLIKVDVEGYETAVLEGAIETLAKQSLHALIMELNGSGNRYDFAESKILAIMRDCGFETYTYDPFTRSLIDLAGKSLPAGNTLFIRDKAAVIERVAAAPLVVVSGRRF